MQHVLAKYVWNAQVKLPHCFIGKHEKGEDMNKKKGPSRYYITSDGLLPWSLLPCVKDLLENIFF